MVLCSLYSSYTFINVYANLECTCTCILNFNSLCLNLCFAGFVCERIHSLISLLKCYNKRKCILFVNTVNIFPQTPKHTHQRTYPLINIHCTDKYTHTHARTCWDITSNLCILCIYYLSHVVCFTSCSCVVFCCVCFFFAVLLSYI